MFSRFYFGDAVPKDLKPYEYVALKKTPIYLRIIWELISRNWHLITCNCWLIHVICDRIVAKVNQNKNWKVLREYTHPFPDYCLSGSSMNCIRLERILTHMGSPPHLPWRCYFKFILLKSMQVTKNSVFLSLLQLDDVISSSNEKKTFLR